MMPFRPGANKLWGPLLSGECSEIIGVMLKGPTPLWALRRGMWVCKTRPRVWA